MLTPSKMHPFVFSTQSGIPRYDMPKFQAGTALCHVQEQPLAAHSSQWCVLVTVTAVLLDCIWNCMEKSFALAVAPVSPLIAT